MPQSYSKNNAIYLQWSWSGSWDDENNSEDSLNHCKDTLTVAEWFKTQAYI